MAKEYAAVPLDEEGRIEPPRRKLPLRTIALAAICAVIFGLLSFLAGYAMGRAGSPTPQAAMAKADEDGRLPPEAFVPQIPTKRVVFEFPTKYEDKTVAGDKLWNDLMPVGAGFVRVPNPRQFDMPDSEPIPQDPEQAEIYSLSVTHQLHCLAVLRDVIVKYEKHDKSRFAGDGHEYHCIDYIRQSILCAGDTTLDYADDRMTDADGKIVRYGFTGANSTHQCRDWDSIKAFAEKNKAGEMTGVFR